MTAIEFRRLIDSEGKVAAAKRIADSVDCDEHANAAIWAYTSQLLRARRYAAAAIVLWGETIFDARPECVQKVWTAIDREPQVLVQGGGAQGKSYTGIVYVFVDWLADPEFTTVKLISTTGGHAKSNTFSTMVTLHKQAICPLPGAVNAESIALYETDKRSCISIVRIREGEDNSGVLQGFHPLPRPREDAVFGKTSRVRAVLDEAEEIPRGVWTGVSNMLTTIDKSGAVKIMGFYNPKDITSKTAQLAEPRGGWSILDIETGVNGSNTWMSREGWYVVRLDPKQSENVKQRKDLYPGFQTYEGYRKLEAKGGGNSLHYYVFGRGVYPPDSAVQVIIPQRVINSMRGEFIFTGKTIKMGACDIAIDGRDEAVFSAGRFGRASALKRSIINEQGKPAFELIKFPEERYVLQLDQQFAIPKGSAEIVAKGIKTTCLSLGISPQFMMLDMTGNGSPVLNFLKIPDVWSPEVRGLDFSKPATATKILVEDEQVAEELYEGIVTEVWFCVSRWGEYGYLAISPTVRSENLERELAGRRYILGAGQKLRVEKKEIYKARLDHSPDSADSLTILAHGARTSGQMLASMIGSPPKPQSHDQTESGIAVTWLP